jgi:hypothetical protein
MRKHWRRILRLTGVAGLSLGGSFAVGQSEYEAPQYPQYVQYPEGAPPVVPGVPGAQVVLSPEQIDQLLGPIALYPDPLLSLIFPAATYPQDVLGAEQWLESRSNPTEADIAGQGWDASIKGLAHYPTVLKMMSGQPDWTAALGAAFLNQQKDVLASVQRLRAQAQAVQNLQTTSQEQVVVDAGDIRIEPVDPEVIYVPQYDANVVYTSNYPVSFGIGFPIGLWDDDAFNWNDGYIMFGGGWYYGWHHPEAWDQRRPSWDRDGKGWSASPREWTRSSRGAAPRMGASVVAHLNLDRARGGVIPNSARGVQRNAPVPEGRQVMGAPSKNAFEPGQSRQDVQRSVQQARPAPAREAPAARQAPAAREAPARQAPAAAAPRAAAPSAQRSAPSGAFSGGSGGEARSQSNRGQASRRH